VSCDFANLPPDAAAATVRRPHHFRGTPDRVHDADPASPRIACRHAIFAYKAPDLRSEGMSKPASMNEDFALARCRHDARKTSLIATMDVVRREPPILSRSSGVEYNLQLLCVIESR
jgi:hypothetical protein